MSHDVFDIEGQEEKEREAQERAKREAHQEAEDFKWIMGSKRGRRMMWRILERGGVYRLSFDTNAMTMAFNEGRRNESLYLTSRLISVCPELHTQMMKENAE